MQPFSLNAPSSSPLNDNNYQYLYNNQPINHSCKMQTQSDYTNPSLSTNINQTNTSFSPDNNYNTINSLSSIPNYLLPSLLTHRETYTPPRSFRSFPAFEAFNRLTHQSLNSSAKRNFVHSKTLSNLIYVKQASNKIDLGSFKSSSDLRNMNRADQNKECAFKEQINARLNNHNGKFNVNVKTDNKNNKISKNNSDCDNDKVCGNNGCLKVNRTNVRKLSCGSDETIKEDVVKNDSVQEINDENDEEFYEAREYEEDINEDKDDAEEIDNDSFNLSHNNSNCQVNMVEKYDDNNKIKVDQRNNAVRDQKENGGGNVEEKKETYQKENDLQNLIHFPSQSKAKKKKKGQSKIRKIFGKK